MGGCRDGSLSLAQRALRVVWPPRLAWRTPVRAQTARSSTDINHIALTVTDLDRARAFYERHLDPEVARQDRNNCFPRCAQHDFVALFKGEKHAMNHYCYASEPFDPGDAVRNLKAVGIEPRRRGDRVYFDDPDGLEVQVAAKTHAV